MCVLEREREREGRHLEAPVLLLHFVLRSSLEFFPSLHKPCMCTLKTGLRGERGGDYKLSHSLNSNSLTDGECCFHQLGFINVATTECILNDYNSRATIKAR